MKPETKAEIGSAAAAVVNGVGEVYDEYERQRTRFKQAAPVLPAWGELASFIPPDAVLTRACMQTLARVNRSPAPREGIALAASLAARGQRRSKVRQALRSTPACFAEVYAGRWQVGDVAEPLRLLLSRRPELAGE
jgi:hypothetical protein